ncbi:MAG: MerR family transcriptional regulator [Alphaproteobacteria bacterium]|nr:MerR family transcriptional regulator [Alphaproteobacteria bacterium]
MASAEDRAAAQPRLVKSPEAFRTISEVAAELDVPPHVLRFWESKFSQVRPLKRGGRRRYYRPEDVALLRRIRALLYSDGYTIRGVQKVLREKGVKGLVSEGGEGHGGDASGGSGEPPAPLDGDRRARLAAALDELGRLSELLKSGRR